MVLQRFLAAFIQWLILIAKPDDKSNCQSVTRSFYGRMAAANTLGKNHDRF